MTTTPDSTAWKIHRLGDRGEILLRFRTRVSGQRRAREQRSPLRHPGDQVRSRPGLSKPRPMAHYGQILRGRTRTDSVSVRIPAATSNSEMLRRTSHAGARSRMCGCANRQGILLHGERPLTSKGRGMPASASFYLQLNYGQDTKARRWRSTSPAPAHLPKTLAQFDKLPRRSQQAIENVAHAVTRMREGVSLKSAAAEFGVDPRTVVQLGKLGAAQDQERPIRGQAERRALLRVLGRAGYRAAESRLESAARAPHRNCQNAQSLSAVPSNR